MLRRRSVMVGGALAGIGMTGVSAARAQLSVDAMVSVVRAFGEAAGLARDIIRIFGLIPTAQAAPMLSLGSSAERVVQSQPTILDELERLRLAIRDDIRAEFLDRDLRKVSALWGEFNDSVVRMGEGELKRARLIALHGEGTSMARLIGSYGEVATFPTYVTAVSLVLATGQLLRDSGDRSMTPAALTGISNNAAQTIEIWASPNRPKNPSFELVRLQVEIDILQRRLTERDRWIKTRETILRFQVQTGIDQTGRPIMQNRWQRGDFGFVFRGLDAAGDPIVEERSHPRITDVPPEYRFQFNAGNGTYPRAVAPASSDITCLRSEPDNYVSRGITSEPVPNQQFRTVGFPDEVKRIQAEQKQCIADTYSGWRDALKNLENQRQTVGSLDRSIRDAFTRFASFRF
jgi:hypothetical protein